MTKHTENRKNKQNANSSKGKTLLIAVGKYAAIIVVLFFVLSVGMVFLYKFAPVYWTPLMSIRRIEARHAGQSIAIRHEWKEYSKISYNLTEAVIVAEDDQFYKHNGFSKKGIQKAIKEKKETGTVKHGGSTITQQTAKNVFCTNHRNMFRKGMEAYFTVLIEMIWSKDRIMEVYLNSIEMGDGVFGAEAAAQVYFHHNAERLTRQEACLIAACLPNPRKWKVNAPGPYVKKRQQALMSRCRKKAYAQPLTDKLETSESKHK